MNFVPEGDIWVWEWYLALGVVFGPGSGISLLVVFHPWQCYLPFESGIWPVIPFSARISSKYHMVFETILHCPAVVYGQISVYHSSAVVYGICTLPYTTAGEWYMESKPILAEHGIKSVLHVKIRWSQGIRKQIILSTRSSNWTCAVHWSRASPRSINLTGSIRSSCAGVTFTCVYPSSSYL